MSSPATPASDEPLPTTATVTTSVAVPPSRGVVEQRIRLIMSRIGTILRTANPTRAVNLPEATVRQLLLAAASNVKKEADKLAWAKHVEVAMAGMAARTAAAAASSSSSSSTVAAPAAVSSISSSSTIGAISENEVLNYFTMSLAAGEKGYKLMEGFCARAEQELGIVRMMIKETTSTADGTTATTVTNTTVADTTSQSSSAPAAAPSPATAASSTDTTTS